MAKWLVLGGTFEARQYAEKHSKKHQIIYSLAGVTQQPDLPSNVKLISGGFGGVSGLSEFIKHQGIEKIIDGTHPQARMISKNALLASRMTKIPIMTIERSIWLAEEGDQWSIKKDWHQLALSIETIESRNVFLAIGSKHAHLLTKNTSHQYHLRCINAPRNPSNNINLILAKGPFSIEQELILFRDLKINLLVCKQRGGTIGKEKLIAARKLKIPVLMLDLQR